MSVKRSLMRIKMTYQEVLQSVSYPIECVVLDFESYFDVDYSLSKISTIEYITDSRFEFCGVGVLDSRNGNCHYIDPELMGKFLRAVQWDNVTTIVKHARFDITVLKEKFGIEPKYIIDVEDLSRHWDSRMSQKLKDLAILFGLQPKGDTMKFKGFHWDDMTPGMQRAMREYCKNDVILEWELFQKLLPLLTNAEQELALMAHTRKLYLNPAIKFDFEKADELIMAMEEKLNNITENVGYTSKQLSSSIFFVEILGEALPDGETIPVKAGKPGKNLVKALEKINGVPSKHSIPALSKDDDGMKELLAHKDLKVRALVEARQALRSWPLHIKRVKNMAAQSKVSDGYFRVPLVYYGGHTGRWSGTERVNPQNFGGKGRAGAGTDPLIGKVRELLRAG